MSSMWDRLPACRSEGDRLEAYPTAIIGVGSSHGDDQFGWAVADALNAIFHNPKCERGLTESTPRLRVGLPILKINNPIDLIPMLDEFDRMIVVDAAVGLPNEVWFQKLDFADADDRAGIREIPHRGTHDVGLYQVLRLGELLGKRSDPVELWIGNAKEFSPLSPMSPELTTAASQCAAVIATELCDARMVAGSKPVSASRASRRGERCGGNG